MTSYLALFDDNTVYGLANEAVVVVFVIAVVVFAL